MILRITCILEIWKTLAMDASGFCLLLTLRIELQDVLQDHPSILPHPTYPPHLTIFIAVSDPTPEVDTILACELKPRHYKQNIFINYTATQKYFLLLLC
jgi:hypothetical protein